MRSGIQRKDSRIRSEASVGSRCAAIALLGFVLSVGIPASAAGIPPSDADLGPYVTNGPVQAVAHAGGRTYIGGDFTRVGRRTGSGAAFSPLGAPQVSPAEVAGGDVRAVVADGAGGWYIGGTFTAVGGQSHLGLAHVLNDGTVDRDFAPSVRDSSGKPGVVNALALSTTDPDAHTLYVGGEFFKIGIGDGQFHSNIAALDGTTGAARKEVSVATGCQPQPGCSPAVRALALTHVSLKVNGASRPEPLLFYGGSFTQTGFADGPKSVTYAAAVWGVGATDSAGAKIAGQPVIDAFSAPNPWAPNLDGPVDAIQVRPTISPLSASNAFPVYFGGETSTLPFLRAVQFKLPGANDRTASSTPYSGAWNPNPAGCSGCAVRALALDESASKLYFGGDFTTVGPTNATAGHLASIPAIADTDQTFAVSPATPTPLTPGVEGPVRALGLVGQPATVVAGGSFDAQITRLDASGAAFSGWSSPLPDAAVNALASTPSAIYAGGEFRSVDSHMRHGLAALDSSGALVDAWNPSVASADGSPHVHALGATDSTVYVGGQFDHVAGVERRNLAAVDAGNGSLRSFDPRVSLARGKADVLSIALLGSTVYAGGNFDQVGGQSRTNVAAVDADSGSVNPWSPAVKGGTVNAILPACGAVYLGGWFSQVGDQSRPYLAAVDPASGAPTGWDPGSEGAVLALARSGGAIYAGGTFAVIGGGIRQKLAALDVATAQATADFDPGLDGPVEALVTTDSNVYVGGRFNTVAGTSRSNLAAVSQAGALSEWAPAADGQVFALAAGSDALYAGGAFGSIGTVAQRGFATFSPGAGSPVTSDACSSPPTKQVAEPTPAPPQLITRTSPPARVPVSAQISRLAVTPGVVRVGRRSLTVRFILSGVFRVRIRFERRAIRRCRRGGRLRTCARYVRFAEVEGRGTPGVNRISFPRQRIGSRRLIPGTYRVTVEAVPSVPGSSPPRAPLTVVR